MQFVFCLLQSVSRGSQNSKSYSSRYVGWCCTFYLGVVSTEVLLPTKCYNYIYEPSVLILLVHFVD